MIPDQIFLVRHGESEGNVNGELYKTVPDPKLRLTKKGREQAKIAGERILSKVGACTWYQLREPQFRIYCSPWYRTRETAEEIQKAIQGAQYREDPRICEQQWGNYLREHYKKRIDKERDGFGTFFYRMPEGESGLDVYTRVASFTETLWRDFRGSCPSKVIIVSHGLTIRLFLMKWFHLTVEEYEELANPSNGSVIEMRMGTGWQAGKYELVSKLRKKR